MSFTPLADSYVGLPVAFMLTQYQVDEIVKARIAKGKSTYRANDVHDGQIVAGIIVNDWYKRVTDEWIADHPDMATQAKLDDERRSAERPVNIQILLDGDESYWVTSATRFDPEKHISMLNVDGNRINVYIHGKQQMDYWLENDYTEPEADARGHWWFPADTFRSQNQLAPSPF